MINYIITTSIIIYDYTYSRTHNYCEHHFSGYFKYHFTYDHFFFTVRSPCHTALIDSKSS